MSGEYFRKMAEVCLKLAAETHDPEVGNRLRLRAAEYLERAEVGGDGGLPPAFMLAGSDISVEQSERD